MTQPFITFDFRDHTLQETHNHIVRFMRKQGVASVYRSSTVCAYRGVGENNTPTACGIGCAISDALYYRGMEGASAHGLMTRDVFANSRCTDVSYDKTWSYFEAIQNAHDDHMPYPQTGPMKRDNINRSLALFEREAERVAARFGLEHPANTPSG